MLWRHLEFMKYHMDSMVDATSTRHVMSFDDASRIQVMVPLKDDVIKTHAALHVGGEKDYVGPRPSMKPSATGYLSAGYSGSEMGAHSGDEVASQHKRKRVKLSS